MRTFAFLFAFAAGVALAQAPGGNPPPLPPMPPPGSGATGQPGEDMKCQMKCATDMTKCMDPCMPKNTSDMDKPGAKNNVASCAKRCAAAQQPCMAKCGAGADKGKKGKSGGDEP